VVVYSPHGPDVLRDYEERFEAAYPDVDVQALDMGSQEVYTRVQGEAGRPQADVWWGGPSTMFMRAADDGLLASYRPSWAEAVDGAYHDAEDRWYGTYRSPLGIVFNTEANTAASVPSTWDGLLDPAWHGKVTLRKPMPSGTMRTFIGAMVLRQPGVDEGFAWLRRLHAATESYEENPRFLYNHLKRRPELISVWIVPDVYLQRQRNGYPFACVIPERTPVLTEGIALVAGGPNPEWARTFYEFVTTREALAHQANAYAKVPARDDLDAAALPAWMTAQSFEPMDIDWEAFAEKEQAWTTRWERDVYHAP
jgi:iron(III) transport system substrate-binding protein